MDSFKNTKENSDSDSPAKMILLNNPSLILKGKDEKEKKEKEKKEKEKHSKHRKIKEKMEIPQNKLKSDAVKINKSLENRGGSSKHISPPKSFLTALREKAKIAKNRKRADLDIINMDELIALGTSKRYQTAPQDSDIITAPKNIQKFGKNPTSKNSPHFQNSELKNVKIQDCEKLRVVDPQNLPSKNAHTRSLASSDLGSQYFQSENMGSQSFGSESESPESRALVDFQNSMSDYTDIQNSGSEKTHPQNSREDNALSDNISRPEDAFADNLKIDEIKISNDSENTRIRSVSKLREEKSNKARKSSDLVRDQQQSNAIQNRKLSTIQYESQSDGKPDDKIFDPQRSDVFIKKRNLQVPTMKEMGPEKNAKADKKIRARYERKCEKNEMILQRERSCEGSVESQSSENQEKGFSPENPRERGSSPKRDRKKVYCVKNRPEKGSRPKGQSGRNINLGQKRYEEEILSPERREKKRSSHERDEEKIFSPKRAERKYCSQKRYEEEIFSPERRDEEKRFSPERRERKYSNQKRYEEEIFSPERREKKRSSRKRYEEKNFSPEYRKKQLYSLPKRYEEKSFSPERRQKKHSSPKRYEEKSFSTERRQSFSPERRQKKHSSPKRYEEKCFDAKHYEEISFSPGKESFNMARHVRRQTEESFDHYSGSISKESSQSLQDWTESSSHRESNQTSQGDLSLLNTKSSWLRYQLNRGEEVHSARYMEHMAIYGKPPFSFDIGLKKYPPRKIYYED